jgi:ABC-type nitrate/sulfonate/bicarbonate transport system substrate-binding protein
VLALALVLLVGATAARADPVKIRLGVVPVPASLVPVIFAKPGIARHAGKSYVLDPIFFQGSPVQITALQAGEIDIASLGFSTFSVAIENAGMKDLRVIADEVRLGVKGYGGTSFMVLKNGPIHRIEDLKGKVVVTNAIGGALDMVAKAMLLKHGLVAPRDYSVIEAGFPNMTAMLLQHKADFIVSIEPFIEDRRLQSAARELFTTDAAMGPVELIFWTARQSFIQKNRAAVVDLIEDYIRELHWAWDPAHRQEAIRMVAAATKQPEARLASYIYTHKDNYQDLNAKPDLAAIARNIHAQKALGLIKSDIDVARYADLSLVNAAAKRVK